MRFEVLPILDKMIKLYEQPASIERFNKYLNLVEGNSNGDYVLPVGGFNPMAKEHVLLQMLGLKKLGIEKIISTTLAEINKKYDSSFVDHNFKVCFNLSDDLKGGWTNRYTSDYQNKFKLNPLIKRRFCVPVFWTSEEITLETIINRTKEFCYRTIYALEHGSPKTLKEHLLQELFVLKEINPGFEVSVEFEKLMDFYRQHQDSTERHILLNFIYGDKAPVSLGNSPLGIKEDFAGYRFLTSVLAHKLSIA